jgi:hypothetical protein
MAGQNYASCTACTTCYEQNNCCMVTDACIADMGCKYILDCQLNCYNGMSADGGALPDASQGAEDQCANNCLLAAVATTPAAMTAWNNYQNCISPACDTPCLCP